MQHEANWGVPYGTGTLSRPHRDLFSKAACRIVMLVTAMGMLFPIPHAVIRVEGPGPVAKFYGQGLTFDLAVGQA